MRLGIKDLPYVVGYWDEVRFKEFRVRGTGFYTQNIRLMTEETVSTIHLLPYNPIIWQNNHLRNMLILSSDL